MNNIICIVCLACDCLGEKVNLEPEDVNVVYDDDNIITEPEVRVVRTMRECQKSLEELLECWLES